MLYELVTFVYILECI